MVYKIALELLLWALDVLFDGGTLDYGNVAKAMKATGTRNAKKKGEWRYSKLGT